MFKVKYAQDGSIARYKVRLVAQGFSQVYGIDFNKRFSLTVTRELLRIFLAIGCLLGLIIEQIDIVGAYLESLLSDNDLPIFMKLPPDMRAFRSIRFGLVCRLLRSIYGLRQLGWLLNQNIISFLKGLGFEVLNADASILIFQGHEKDNITMISVYVDDFLLALKQQALLDLFKESLKNEYNVKDLRVVKTIIGWQVTRDLDAGTLKINQSAFIRDLLEEENLMDCNSVNIPMNARGFIEMLEANDYEEADIKTFQRLIRKLMYLSYVAGPDIAFAVGQLSKRNADPRVGHLKVAKRVVQYRKWTMYLRIIYGASKVKDLLYGLIRYADSNYAGDPKDRKSVMGNCFFINGGIMS